MSPFAPVTFLKKTLPALVAVACCLGTAPGARAQGPGGWALGWRLDLGNSRIEPLLKEHYTGALPVGQGRFEAGWALGGGVALERRGARLGLGASADLGVSRVTATLPASSALVPVPVEGTSWAVTLVPRAYMIAKIAPRLEARAGVGAFRAYTLQEFTMGEKQRKEYVRLSDEFAFAELAWTVHEKSGVAVVAEVNDLEGGLAYLGLRLNF